MSRATLRATIRLQQGRPIFFIGLQFNDREGRVERDIFENLPPKFVYETLELKLAALLLSEIPEATLNIGKDVNPARKTLLIFYPKKYKNTIASLEKHYINKQATTNIYCYNKALNLIRDRLRGKNEEWMGKASPSTCGPLALARD